MDSTNKRPPHPSPLPLGGGEGEKSRDKVAINRIRGDDDVRLPLLQQRTKRVTELVQAAQLPLKQSRVVESRIKPGPQSRRVAHDPPVGFHEKSVEPPVSRVEQVKDLDAYVRRGKCERVPNAASGGVVAVAKAGGQDQYLLHSTAAASTDAPTGSRLRSPFKARSE